MDAPEHPSDPGWEPIDPDSLPDPFAIGAEPELPPIRPPASVDRIPQRYRRSASASILAASLLGLRDVIEPPKDDRPVVEQYADEGDRERPIEVYLDPDDPSASLVVIRNPADLN